jgi:hypothetical protein
VGSHQSSQPQVVAGPYDHRDVNSDEDPGEEDESDEDEGGESEQEEDEGEQESRDATSHSKKGRKRDQKQKAKETLKRMRQEDPETAKKERVATMCKELRKIAREWLGEKYSAEVKAAYEAGYVSTPSAVRGSITYKNKMSLDEYKPNKKKKKNATEPKKIEYPEFKGKVLRSKNDFKKYFGGVKQNLDWKIMEPLKLRLDDDGLASAFLLRVYVPDSNEFIDIDVQGALDCDFFNEKEFTVIIAFTIKHYKEFDPNYKMNNAAVIKNALVAGDDPNSRSKKQEQDKEELQQTDPNSFVTGWLYPHVKIIAY